MPLKDVELLLTEPRGFCAGVDRAIDIVNRAVEIFDQTVYVKHEVVHNKHVIKDLVNKGVIFVESLDDVPDGSILIYSAHGVSKEVCDQAKSKNLKVFDATCPLVTKVHFEIHKYASENIDVVLIGHSGHPEVEGTMGQYISNHGQIHCKQAGCFRPSVVEFEFQFSQCLCSCDMPLATLVLVLSGRYVVT